MNGVNHPGYEYHDNTQYDLRTMICTNLNAPSDCGGIGRGRAYLRGECEPNYPVPAVQS